ncbi:MAG: nuclear transport factor 2 family protein [Flavobacteriaceae bacterium]|nr:nuclear transport factor 2 family protein [Flavobacteriaceae bacterium]
MKKFQFSLLVLALLTFIACKDAAEEAGETVEETVKEVEKMVEKPDYAAFDKNVGVIRAFIAAHEKEDLAAQTALLSDTMSWSPPSYNGNKMQGKTELLAALKGYHDSFENIKFTEGIVTKTGMEPGMWSGSHFPKGSANMSPDAIRVYGTWTAKHSASGKDIGVKYYAIMWVNSAGKIAGTSTYFDVNGIQAQLKAK